MQALHTLKMKSRLSRWWSAEEPDVVPVRQGQKGAPGEGNGILDRFVAREDSSAILAGPRPRKLEELVSSAGGTGRQNAPPGCPEQASEARNGVPNGHR